MDHHRTGDGTKLYLGTFAKTAGADHLKALARVSRLLHDRAKCEKLRGTDSAEAIHALLTESMANHAA